MAREIVSVAEYAALRGISVQAVTKAFRAFRNLPGVVKWAKVGKSYVLTIEREKIGRAVANVKPKG